MDFKAETANRRRFRLFSPVALVTFLASTAIFGGLR
jgi:hypothetical protein